MDERVNGFFKKSRLSFQQVSLRKLSHRQTLREILTARPISSDEEYINENRNRRQRRIG